MQNIPTMTADALREMLSTGQAINVVDIRPLEERAEWFIPGSIHMDVYDQLKGNAITAMNNVYFDKSVPVVTVCAGGKTSVIAADILRQKGYKAFSLQDGMKGWSLAWNTAYEKFEAFELWQIRRTGKGCLSYIIASGKEAIIVDASLPVEVYAKLVNKHKLSVKYVIETHIHADHLSRSRELAQYLKAALYLPIPNKVQFEFNPIVETTNLSIGSITVQPIPTPGHTRESYSFYVNGRVLITGDTLFINGVGRPDLKSTPEESLERACLLYQSLNKLLLLPDSVIVLPAHANKPVEFDNLVVETTIGEARKKIAMLQMKEEEFVNSILQKIPPAPPNYLEIVEKNIIGSYADINPVDLEAGANRCAVS